MDKTAWNRSEKVFLIGLSKTGTTSLYAALMRLGLRTVTWRHISRRGLSRWIAGDFSPDYLADCDAATDMPIGAWFRELDARYPQARFVLTERPLDPWLASVGAQFAAAGDPSPGFRRDVRLLSYGASVFHRDRFARIHAEHAAAVRAHFAGRPGKLLIQSYFVGDGWPGLCDFLGLETPDEPFPNVKPGHRATLGPYRPKAGRP